MIVAVSTQKIMDAWPLVEDYVRQACETNPIQSPVMVLASILAGRAQMLLLVESAEATEVDGCMVMEVTVYPDGTEVANVWVLGGKPGIWARYEEELEATVDSWSKFHGCDIIAMLGRPGWHKVLSDQWQTKPMVMAWRKRNDADSPGPPGHTDQQKWPAPGVRH